MRRVVLILLALLMLAPTAVQSAVWYRCAHDGEARKACCCAPKANEGDRAERDPAPALSAGCCCEVTTIQAPTSSVRESAPDHERRGHAAARPDGDDCRGARVATCADRTHVIGRCRQTT